MSAVAGSRYGFLRWSRSAAAIFQVQFETGRLRQACPVFQLRAKVPASPGEHSLGHLPDEIAAPSLAQCASPTPISFDTCNQNLATWLETRVRLAIESVCAPRTDGVLDRFSSHSERSCRIPAMPNCPKIFGIISRVIRLRNSIVASAVKSPEQMRGVA